VLLGRPVAVPMPMPISPTQILMPFMMYSAMVFMLFTMKLVVILHKEVRAKCFSADLWLWGPSGARQPCSCADVDADPACTGRCDRRQVLGSVRVIYVLCFTNMATGMCKQHWRV
jgi:hypothetical protein